MSHDSSFVFAPQNTESYFYVDEYGLMLVKGDPDSARDTGKRSAFAVLTYEYEPFIEGLRNCYLTQFTKRGREYVQGYRHPKFKWDKINDMSRDHILGGLLAFKFAGRRLRLKYLANHLRWKISDKFKFEPILWSWMKFICAGKWWWGPIFYICAYPTMIAVTLWNRYWLKKGNFSREYHQLNYDPPLPLTDRQRVIRDKLFPCYALDGFIWMLWVIKPNIFRTGLQKIALKMVGQHNYLHEVLLGEYIPQLVIDGYKQMSSWRWTVWTNETDKRGCRLMTNPVLLAANRLEEDLLIKVKRLEDEVRNRRL